MLYQLSYTPKAIPFATLLPRRAQDSKEGAADSAFPLRHATTILLADAQVT